MAKKIVLIEPYTCLPVDSGGKLRIFETIKELSKRYEVGVVMFYKDKEEKLKTKEWLKSIKIKSQFIKTESRSLLSFIGEGVPYWFSEWSRRTKKRMNFEYKDVVIVEFSQLLDVVDLLPKETKKVFVAHDISSVSFWRRFLETSWLKKWMHFFRLVEVYWYERRYLRKYDEIWVMSDNDKRLIKKIYDVDNCIVVPNGVENIKNIGGGDGDEIIRLGFVGSVTHGPNKEAIRFLIDDVVVEMERRGLNYRLYLAGRDNLANNNKHIINLGYVKKVDSFYKKIDMLVAPIFSGSGTRIKILESLSKGVPVITCVVGREGIELDNEYLRTVNLEKEKNPKTWVNEIIKMKKSRGKMNFLKLSNELKKYQWKEIFSKVVI